MINEKYKEIGRKKVNENECAFRIKSYLKKKSLKVTIINVHRLQQTYKNTTFTRYTRAYDSQKKIITKKINIEIRDNEKNIIFQRTNYNSH